MTSNTHPNPFPTLPPPHACMVKLNHTKIIPSKMRGICTLSQLYQCRLSVPSYFFPGNYVIMVRTSMVDFGRMVLYGRALPRPPSQIRTPFIVSAITGVPGRVDWQSARRIFYWSTRARKRKVVLLTVSATVQRRRSV